MSAWRWSPLISLMVLTFIRLIVRLNRRWKRLGLHQLFQVSPSDLWTQKLLCSPPTLISLCFFSFILVSSPSYHPLVFVSLLLSPSYLSFLSCSPFLIPLFSLLFPAFSFHDSSPHLSFLFDTDFTNISICQSYILKGMETFFLLSRLGGSWRFTNLSLCLPSDELLLICSSPDGPSPGFR